MEKNGHYQLTQPSWELDSNLQLESQISILVAGQSPEGTEGAGRSPEGTEGSGRNTEGTEGAGRSPEGTKGAVGTECFWKEGKIWILKQKIIGKSINPFLKWHKDITWTDKSSKKIYKWQQVYKKDNQTQIKVKATMRRQIISARIHFLRNRGIHFGEDVWKRILWTPLWIYKRLQSLLK